MACKEADPERAAPSAVEENAAEHAPDARLLELLVCPLTKSSLEYRAETAELISRRARLAFPIVDGIPLLALEAARTLTEADL